MLDLKPKRYSPLVTLALLLLGSVSGLMLSSLLGNGHTTVAVAGDMPEPAAMVMMVLGGIVLLKRRGSGKN
jgi:hypothetical protein